MGILSQSRESQRHYTLRAADVWTTTGDDAVWDVLGPITVVRIGAVVTTAVVSTGNVVIDFDKRVTTDSDTGRVTDGVGQLKVATATGVGKVVYKDVRVNLDAGDQVVVAVGTAAAGGGAAGGGRYFFEYVPREETAANQADMVASAA